MLTEEGREKAKRDAKAAEDKANKAKQDAQRAREEADRLRRGMFIKFIIYKQYPDSKTNPGWIRPRYIIRCGPDLTCHCQTRPGPDQFIKIAVWDTNSIGSFGLYLRYHLKSS